jgi:hypothetical protein
MAILRRTPEPFYPTIQVVMVRAGLAPPPPRVSVPTTSTRAPSRWHTRPSRYHPYGHATLPARDMPDTDDGDMFTVGLLVPQGGETAHADPAVLGRTSSIGGVGGGANRALGESSSPTGADETRRSPADAVVEDDVDEDVGVMDGAQADGEGSSELSRFEDAIEPVVVPPAQRVLRRRLSRMVIVRPLSFAAR